MSEVPSAAFPDEVVREAAQAIIDDRNDGSIEWAAKAGKIDFAGPENDTLLTVAVVANNRDAVQRIVSLGANVNVPVEVAPIALATEGASSEIVSILLDANADPNGAVGSQTALWRAALGNRQDVVEMLLARGASIDRANVDGDTPFIAAIRGRHYDMASYLLGRGATPFAVAFNGRTAGYWINRANIDPTSDKGRARDRLVQALKDRGHPWPPPGPDEVLAMKAAGQWPPR